MYSAANTCTLTSTDPYEPCYDKNTYKQKDIWGQVNRFLSLLVNYFCTQFENVTLKTITSQQNCWWTDGQCDNYYRAPPFSCEALNIVMIHKEKNFSLYAHEECSLRIKGIYMYIQTRHHWNSYHLTPLKQQTLRWKAFQRILLWP